MQVAVAVQRITAARLAQAGLEAVVTLAHLLQLLVALRDQPVLLTPEAVVVGQAPLPPALAYPDLQAAPAAPASSS